MLERSEIPTGSQGRFLKAAFGVRAAAHVFSSDWLVTGGEEGHGGLG